MLKILAPFAAAALIAAPAFAAGEEAKPLVFERDGVRYVATIKTVGDTMLIRGREVDSGATFDLSAKNGRVSGTYDNNLVEYPVSR